MLGKQYLTESETIRIDDQDFYLDYRNKRIKFYGNMNLYTRTIKKIINYAMINQFGKIICFCDNQFKARLTDLGFEIEGKIDGYFKGEDAFCLSYFTNIVRRKRIDSIQKDLLIKQCLENKNATRVDQSTTLATVRNACFDDIKEMQKLFLKVFSSYPSPIHEEEYLIKMMREKVLYKVAIYNGCIVGIASAEMDKENLNAEITDCVTHPEFRGKGILTSIIVALEKELYEMGYITLYSLSRALNPGINMALSKLNYRYTGRLIKNCHICGAFEDMNIWVKRLG